MTVLIGQTQYSVAARAALQRHRSIRDHFAAELFAEPALEALLQLFIAQEEGVRLSMLTLSRQCSVSESTGLRWIARLEALGYCDRIADHQDHRRSWIVMSDDGCRRMRRWLDTQPREA
ncbi:hypothetical protein SAQ01S_25430 [Sphingomonas aquatilis NBRC 16722]|uniref:Membrane-anchored protein n=1 Tax=Sphingomonas aquatilis TaxID=93063 RepID=A0AAW3TSP3_9SPHN|nr:hypothetical protein [Sphingomonas aquatilis]MBB3875125.1 putative membrane-anchored protein [Sphingomonas aquatilis]GEM72777.1 hypothetical protein SAQ01S_25430 [Sphingomonas aquatilis NBRC 16722]